MRWWLIIETIGFAMVATIGYVTVANNRDNRVCDGAREGPWMAVTMLKALAIENGQPGTLQSIYKKASHQFQLQNEYPPIKVTGFEPEAAQ
jgi:hypothetical protein